MTKTIDNNGLQLTTLAGGCFWCIEGAFTQVQGIHSAISGYMGGHTDNPSYEEICTGKSGHAEVVQLSFDTTIISYQEILEIFLLYTIQRNLTAKVMILVVNTAQLFFITMKISKILQKI